MKKLRIDILSDLVCPWCFIGYTRLEKVLAQLRIDKHLQPEIHWHPFELNPTLPAGGEILNQHLQTKYQMTAQQRQLSQQKITKLGNELGIHFQFTADMRIYNTRKAHQLMMWAARSQQQTPFQKALFLAYFQEGQIMDDTDTLLDIAVAQGLDRRDCRRVLTDPGWSSAVVQTEKQWLEAGIQAVPAMIIEQHILLNGAQPITELHDTLDGLIDTLPSLH
ncbi:DsbA family oxidoreductase [Vibrio gazogenes]|uniref:Predicted dithiol-disulfide isomerase, DsbA family n=1 Tax=Vibrio gazogenes DSM 21264 = NBRC 103151 TaxID=1123492 RepID=A0A1M4T070_VIBGA|nr:DsbA family oxidoreductase [Vibrio gazogenes]USP15986.1 DsbA family oxidoreductase [Vibrio gazogenes]SHE37825.1 Predicted dithiol-disulfide isomerase, DsbA family [Vibrio gazogenes DSM 21264] [Vibrio gazogenes DSM 21264 = NBRC 103151]SJN54726.1 DSBA-like thioredoxin domain protein [Vibrio gazogenes]